MKFTILFYILLGTSGLVLADDSDDTGAKLYEYFETFNAKDMRKVANEIYSTPVHIGGGDGHRVLENPDAAVANLTNLFVQIEAQGWVESRIENLKICVASPTLALVDTRYSRIDKEGNAIPPAIRTTLYVLQKIEGDWRVVAFYGHDNDSRPACN